MRYFIIFLLLFVISCSSDSSNKKDNVKNKLKQTSNEPTKINTDYKYEKLDVAKLYSASDKEILKEIDLSNIKNIKNSLLYSESSSVYIERSPLEVYELLVKKANKRSIQDNILFLKISLELGKNENINDILNKLKSSDLVISEIKEVNSILARFNLFDKETSFTSYRLEKLLNNNKKFDEDGNSRFLILINLINSIETTNLIKIDKNKFFNKYFKIDKFNETINSKYINELINSKKYSKVEKFINDLLSTVKNKKILYNKKSLLTSLVSIYKITKQNSKIRDLYLLNTKLPENKELFYEYIRYLKSEKIWAKELKYFITKFNKEKSLASFYRYYFSLKYENKNIAILLTNYYEYLLENKNDEAIKDISKLLRTNGKYKEAFNLLNIALINNKNSKYYDDYLISMGKIVEGLPYTESMYKSYYFFSTPEIIGGILSLIQNQHKNNGFLSTIDNQNNLKTRIEDMDYLFEKSKKLFKSNEKLAIFSQNYFYFLKRYKQANKIKKLVVELKKLNKDIYFNIFLLKTTRSITQNKKKIALLNNEIYNLYLKLLLENKNSKDKFNKYLSETLGFLNNFKLGKAIIKLNSLIKIYPDNEKIYEKLLILLGNYRAYNKKLVIYEKALEKFNKKTWADKYSRFLIRKKWNDKMLRLNKRLVNLLNKDDYQKYLTSSFSSKKYGSFTSAFNQLYEQVYVDALKKYPFNKAIINKLLNFYNDFRYSYRYKDSNATYKYALLLYKYIYIYDDFRDRYFKDRLITKKMNHDKIVNSILKKKKKTIPDLKYLAYMLEYKGEFEKSVKYYSILSKYYITNKNIIFKTAKLYKSLASSFYIKDKSFLEKSETLYKRLSFLYRNESKYYISLAELYYELIMKNKAQKSLFRALEFEKGSEQKYIDIANMFYDYYDYDNALKTIYIYRNRKANDDLLIPFVGRLFELKKQEKLAIKEYFRDLLNEKRDSYQSAKRLKFLINKKSLKDLILLNIEGNISNVSNNEVLFNKFKAFIISINNNELLDKLYSSLYDDGNNITLLKQLYYTFKGNKDSRAEELLKKIEKLEKSDEVYRMLISFYKEKKNVKEASDYYEKLLLNNPFENDKYSFINIIEDYSSYLIKNKEYEGAINKYNDLLVYLKKQNEKLKYKLSIADIYVLQSENKYLTYLLKLDSEYPDSEVVSNKIFFYYKKSNKIKEMLSYLNELIKRTKKEINLSYIEKKKKVARYRSLLIEQLIALKKYNSVLDQYIEILNRNPLDSYMVNKVYNFARINKLEVRLFDYYTKLSKKSFKNHKYLLLNARLNLLKGDYNKTLSYYQKAKKLEPQKLEIKYSIADTFIKLKEYSKAYNLYNGLYLKEQNEYTKKDLLKKMFEVAMYLNNTKLIEDLAFRIVRNKSKNYYDYDSKYVAQTLYKHNFFELARNYYDKLIMNAVKSIRYIDGDVFYQYSKTFINKGEGLLLIRKIFELIDELNSLDSVKHKYTVSNNKNVLLTVITKYIPENISYFTASEISSINSYLDNLDNRYSSYVSQYYKKMNLMDKYFSKLTGSYVKNTKYNYYKAALDYDSIINQGLYKVYGYRKRENKTLSNYKKAFLYYVWKDKKTAVEILENNIKNCDTYNKNTIATNVYIEYLRKHNPNKYRNLTKNTCIYNDILSVYIKYSEKKLALELINNQKQDKAWKLTQKVNLYWALEEFNKEGVNIYNELLSTNLSISEELNKDMLLTETSWNNLINRYSNYLLKSNLASNLDDYINNILEISPKSIKSYLTIADIYYVNKKYKKSVEYLNYASQLKNKIIIEIKLADNYLKLGKLDKFNKIKAKILKSSNLNSFYKFYKILKSNKKLDNYFISIYSDLLIKNYKTYGYYKLRNFIQQVTDYYKNKNITILASFVNNFKDGKYEVYKSILFNNQNSFNNDYKIKLFNKIISYYSEIKDDYSKRTWVLAEVEFLSITKKYNLAIEFLNKYKQLFEYEDRPKYNFYMFKLYYSSKNFDFAKKIFTSQLNHNDYSEYGVNKYFNFIMNEEDSKKEFLLDFYTELRGLTSLSKDNLIKLLGYFKNDSNLKTEILYLINNLYLSQTQLSSLETLASKKNLLELYKLILENKYNEFYSNYNYKKLNNYTDKYYSYILTLIKLNKIDKLRSAIDDRKLSVAELYLINTEINGYSDNEKILMLVSLNFENIDIYYIKALLNYSLKKYDIALSELNKIDVSKDYKYNLKIPLLKVDVLSKLNKVNDLGELKKAIKTSPYNNDLKYLLFEYYLKNKDNEKAMFVLGTMGSNLYLVFDNIVAEYFKYLSLYGYSNGYEGDYYDYYQPEKLAEEAFGTADKDKNNYIENFISKYSDKQRKTIVKFLYQQYQKIPKNKKLGLSILYSYSKLDKSYKKEYDKLKESK